MGQLDPTRNPTQPVTRLTRNSINPFKNDPFWPVTRFDLRPDWPDPNPTQPDPPVLPCLQKSVYKSMTINYLDKYLKN